MIASAGDGHIYRVRLNGRDVSNHATRAISFLGYGKVWLYHYSLATHRLRHYTQWGRVTVRKLT